MAAISIKYVSETQHEGRIDAEFFHPKYELLDNVLAKITNKSKFGQLSKFVKKGIFDISPKKYRDEGIPLIRTTQIKTPISNSDNLIYIELKEHQKNHSKTELLKGDIVFTKIGAGIGDVAILNSNYPFYNFSQNVAGASINREKINPYYLIAFLISNYGKDQILRYMMPSGQGKLELKDIKKILIFRDEKNEESISELIYASEKNINLSLKLYQQANDLLKQALGLDKISFESTNSYIANFSEVINNNRSDADFYQTKFKQLALHINTLNTVYLGSICSFLKGFEVGTPAYTDFGPTFIRVSNLTKDGFSFGNSDKYISEETFKNLKKYQPKIGDILLTKDGTIGTCNVVDEEVQGIISSGIMNLTLNDTNIPKEYLALVINSQICQMQADRDCSGALITHWKPEQIRKLKIPILEKETMLKLAELVSNSKIARKQSKDLLTQAKNRVEQLIEEAANKN